MEGTEGDCAAIVQMCGRYIAAAVIALMRLTRVVGARGGLTISDTGSRQMAHHLLKWY
jgi:hypothetical protein